MILNKTYGLVGVMLIAFVLINVLALDFNQRWDLTSDKRYTISERNKKIINAQTERMVITLLMGDQIPASFKKLKSEARFLLTSIYRENDLIKYDVFDPSQGNAEQRKAINQIFAQKNVNATNIRVATKDGVSETYIYPYIHIESTRGEKFVNILESKLPNETELEAIYRSILSMEGKIIKGIFELSKEKQNRIGLVAFGDLLPRRTFDMVNNLKREFNTEILSTSDLLYKRDSFSMAIIPVNPRDEISKADLLRIDQFQMHGGSLLWLIEEYDMHIDSIAKYGEYIPLLKESKVSDYLFSHGLKLSGTWIQDMRCSRVPQVIGEQGGKAQTELLNYAFHIVAQGSRSNVISSNTGEISMFYPTVIDTIPSSSKSSITPLITSSEYSKLVRYPYSFSFEEMRSDYQVESFIEKNKMIGVLLEGEFQSYFKNRITEKEKVNLKMENKSYQSQSNKNSSMIVITDQDFAMSGSDRQGRPYPIGYNKWERNVFPDNQSFLINAIEYMLNGPEFLTTQSDANMAFAALDKRKVSTQGSTYVWFNMLTPLIILIMVYLGLVFFLKRKYA